MKNLPPELVEKILSTPGITIGVNGMTTIPKPTVKRRAKDRPLIAPSILLHNDILTAVLPIDCSIAEVNARDWKGRSRRNNVAWKVVSKYLGKELALLSVYSDHFHAGLPLLLKFIRIGGRTLDRSNLPTATKAVEDALAFIMGANDGSPLWRASWNQESGTKFGIRIEIRRGGLPRQNDGID